MIDTQNIFRPNGVEDASEETKRLARADSIHLLYRQSAPAFAIVILSTLLISAVLWESADHQKLLGWIGLVYAAIFCRGAIYALYFRRKPTGVDRLKWELPFVLALFASALIWSLGLTAVAFNLPLESRLFSYFFLMGMAAGAISVFIVLRYAAIITVSIMLLPMTLVFLASGNPPEIITAVAACTAIISTISGTKILGNNLSKVFVLTHELADKTHKLEQARLNAEHAKNTRGQFIASVSHEIRTPLNVMLGMVEMMRTEPISTSVARYVQTLEAASSHLRSLVDNVLDFVKIDEDKMELHAEPSNIVEIAQSTIEMFGEAASKKGVKLSLDHKAFRHPIWYVDQQRLKQILFNVVGNALKYSDRGTITVKLHSEFQNTGISIIVADQGQGIQQAQLEQIFEPYTQGLNRRLDDVPSTGLGLAITKSLVGLMNGRIHVKSRVGVGSVFKITLPLAPETTPHTEFAREAPLGSSYSILRGKTLLVAEDMPLNRELIHDFLTDAAIEPVFVASGAEALEKLRNQSFDLILLDLQMAPMGGIETTREIRQKERQTGGLRSPILIQSADNRLESVDASLAAGADYFLSKPFSRHQLLGALQQFSRPNNASPASEKFTLDPVLVRLIPRFVTDMEAALGCIQIAIRGRDFIVAAKELHKVKGFCGLFQQANLFQVAENWEQCCLRGDLQQSLNLQMYFLSAFEHVKVELQRSYDK